MAWNTLTAAQIIAEILPDELTILNTLQGSSTILSNSVLPSCVAEIQQVILNSGNQIGQPGTVPDQILRDVIPWIRWEWFCALPKTDLQSDARKDQAARWEKRAAIIRGDDVKQREKIEIPANPQNVAGADSRMQITRHSHQDLRGFNKLGET